VTIPKKPEVIEFSDEVLQRIVAALPEETPRERVKAVPELMRAWAREDLQGHLNRERRSAFKERQERLSDLGRKTYDLLYSILTLQRDGHLDDLLMEMQARVEIKDGTPSSNKLGLPDDLGAGERRLNEAVEWLLDLLEALGPEPRKPPPDIYTRNQLIIQDLAAIFELVTGTRATRRISADTSKDYGNYGPFWNFALPVWETVRQKKRGLGSSIRDWADEVYRQEKQFHDKLDAAQRALGRPLDSEQDGILIEAIARRFHSYSSFVSNLQFRHTLLWQELRGTRR
jgi:hypothetical protein